MSIRSQAAIDVQANLNADFDDVVLIPPEDGPITVKGFIKRVDVNIDSDGVKIHSPATKITISLLDLEDYGEPSDDWQVQTTDVIGNEIVGVVTNLEFNRTNGTVSFIVEETE